MEDYETVATTTVDTTGRLDQTILRLLPTHFATMSAAKKAVRRHEILVNGTRLDRTEYAHSVMATVFHPRVGGWLKEPLTHSAAVKPGDLLEWQQRRGRAAQPAWRIARQETQLAVVYEDDHLACVIKPPGWSTRVRFDTVVDTWTPHKHIR